MIKKTIILGLALISLSISSVYAQSKDAAAAAVGDAMATKDLKGDLEEGWNKSSSFGANFNATGFNDNWKNLNRGVMGNSNMHFIINHNNALLSGKNIWVNNFEGQIGFLKNGAAFEETEKGEYVRNIDKLFLNSMYGRLISDKMSAFAEGNFISQFMQVKDNSKTNRNVASGFLAPGYLTLSTGVEYRPTDYFTVKLAPLAQKWTVVSNKNIAYDAESGLAYGVNVGGGKKSVSEFGSQLTLGFNKEVVENINLGFRYNVFQAWKVSDNTWKTVYTNIGKDAPKVKPLDHRLDLLATAKVNKYINVNFSLIGIVDKDMFNHEVYNKSVSGNKGVKNSVQLATGFGIGFLANF